VDAPADTAGALPCQDSDNSTLPEILAGPHAKRSFSLRENVRAMVETAGLERVGFLTLTFKGGIPSLVEAQRRFNSFASHFLKRFGSWIAVVERHRKGGVHFHLLVDCKLDIRTNAKGQGTVDFDAFKRRDYRSASQNLRTMWAECRQAQKRYGFGERAIELLPIRVSGKAVASYLSKYLGKHLANRRKTDRRKKFIRYSKGSNKCRQTFSWASPGAAAWRTKIGVLAKCCGGDAQNWRLKETLGPRWAHHVNPVLLAMRSYDEPGRMPEFGIEELMAVFAVIQSEKCRQQRRRPPDIPKSNWRRLAVDLGVFRTLERFQQGFVHAWSEIEPGTALDLWCSEAPDEWWEAVVETCNQSLSGEGFTLRVKAGMHIALR